MNNDFIPKILTQWATPKEFDKPGKVITPLVFRLLTIEEVTKLDGKPPLYPPRSSQEGGDGKVRRLYFLEENFSEERRLDVNSPSFQRDLSNCGMKPGVKGRLWREPIPGKRTYRWVWEPIGNERSVNIELRNK